ncbi:MAG: type I-C CRISPR-associated protein Cas8c/Csd1 [Burkholderiaceae bacterium]
MILQALKQYYDRKAANPDDGIAPRGFEWKEIPFIIVLDREGRLVQIEDTRTVDGKKKRAKAFLVPQAEKRSSGIKAYRLWDNAEYVFGLGDARKKQEAFLARLEEFAGLSDLGIAAIKRFLLNEPMQHASTTSEWAEIAETKPWLTFRLAGETDLICQHPRVIDTVDGQADDDPAASRMVCLLTGEEAAVTRLHASLKGVKGANTTGADIVSFNLRAFESYGKEQRQGYNAPIGESASFAYTTALNHLLRKDSTQKVQVGDATTVFWADVPHAFETSFAAVFGDTFAGNDRPDDDPDRNVRAVESLFRSIDNGVYATDDDRTRFFVLGLSPNAARLSVRFWQTGTVAEFASRIRRHFEDLEIERAPFDPPYLSLHRLLVSVATLGKIDNIPPNLAGDTVRAILTGMPYPATLLQAAIRRTRAEQAARDKQGRPAPNVSSPRAALIKACINRESRFKNREEELTVSLDINNQNHSYRLGRLFAVLERLQERANPGLNATIRDRYYGAASSTPVTVFANLIKLSKHHLAKLENKGEEIRLEKLIGEILAGIDEFPAHLPLAEQGRFAIGYYHQQRAFYDKTNSLQPEQGASA